MTGRSPRRSKRSSDGGRDRANDERWRREQEDRIALIEGQQGSGRGSAGASPASAGIGARNFDPGAPSRFHKLRVVARFTLLASYLLLGVMIAGIGVTTWLWREGVIAEDGVFALAVLGWLFAGGFSYVLFKFLAEMSWLLADLGDHQLDARNLLIDLRDDLERR